MAIERAKTNTGTLWAGTRRGRIWVTKNADANDPAAVVEEPDCCGTGMNERQSDVVFTRIDTAAQPRRFPSGISVDPRDPTGNTAYVSFSGYEAYSPGQPGHVFKVVFNPATGTATWTDLSFDLGDLPITDVELDAPTGDLYASFDWGVLKLRERQHELGRSRRGPAQGGDVRAVTGEPARRPACDLRRDPRAWRLPPHP